MIFLCQDNCLNRAGNKLVPSAVIDQALEPIDPPIRSRFAEQNEASVEKERDARGLFDRAVTARANVERIAVVGILSLARRPPALPLAPTTHPLSPYTLYSFTFNPAEPCRSLSLVSFVLRPSARLACARARARYLEPQQSKRT